MEPPGPDVRGGPAADEVRLIGGAQAEAASSAAGVGRSGGVQAEAADDVGPGGAAGADLVGLSGGLLRLAAAAAATVLAVTSSGEVVLLAALLGAAAFDLAAAGAVAAALLALAVRWGSTSLDAVSGAQAVLGPGGWVGSAPEVAATWAAASALVLAAPPRRWAAPAFGAAAALGAAGPSAGDAADVAVRVVAVLLATAATSAVGRRVAAGARRLPAAALGAAALVLAVVA